MPATGSRNTTVMECASDRGRNTTVMECASDRGRNTTVMECASDRGRNTTVMECASAAVEARSITVASLPLEFVKKICTEFHRRVIHDLGALESKQLLIPRS